MDADKAQGPDGFSMAFWQASWHFVKDEIMEMFMDFHANETFIKSLNATFLVLIPKKGDAEEKDFRPISLLGSLYKILANVLANRLKRVVGKVVSEAQNAFVEGRQITNASLIANELIDHWQKQKEKGVICKLDIEKAFDSINWQFLMMTMCCMGFGPKWTSWIWQCITIARFSVLINGVSTGFFPNSKGLRQGDPLFPYLFILGMEVLSILLRRAMTSGFISGCNIKGREGAALSISHLLYADDTIIFYEAKEEQLIYLSWVLLWFEASLGLKMNRNKSELIPVGAVENMDAEPGCLTRHLPTTYLGIPLGVAHKFVAIWDNIEEKMHKKLALWKKKFISKGGRITLIKSTLASLPLYQMSIFRIPGAFVKRLEKLQRCFL